MVQPRSERGALHPALAVAAVLFGTVGMQLAFVLVLVASRTGGVRLGLRPAMVVAELALVAPGLVLLLALRGAGALALSRVDRRTALLSVLAGLTLWGMSLGLLNVQYALWLPPDGYLDAFRRLHDQLKPAGPADAVVSLAAIALAPAVCEELLFRGVVLPSLLRSLGPLPAVVAQALLFGVIHVDTVGRTVSLYRVPFAIAVGIGLGALRLRTASLVPPVLAHLVLNALTFGIVPFVDSADDPSQADLPVGLALAVAGAGATAALLRGLRRQPSAPEEPRA